MLWLSLSNSALVTLCRRNLVGPASHSVEISAYDVAALESRRTRDIDISFVPQGQIKRDGITKLLLWYYPFIPSFLYPQHGQAFVFSGMYSDDYLSRVPVSIRNFGINEKWLKPCTDEVLVELGQKGVRSPLTVPVSFVSEHIETPEEIDMGSTRHWVLKWASRIGQVYLPLVLPLPSLQIW
ncbi:hypothetical protein VNO80_17952 [Phaseolus coccineus]|uniref:Uncharacterized protein n=1 Tax=Phaseolus coccineus TaxID=3886 RepID=A0AAN9MCX1_PHACN